MLILLQLGGGISATGMSFGIDSLYSYLSHLSGSICPEGYEVRLLTLFNNGSYNGQYTKSSEQQRQTFNSVSERLSRFAKQESLDTLIVDSNIESFYSLNYTKTHTYRTCGMVLLFQNIISNYYFADSYGPDLFAVDPFEESSHYDLLSLPLLSTDKTFFYSDGTDKTRVEKTEFVAAYHNKIAPFISVCWREMENCCVCPKCVRTMTTLDIIGYLDAFSEAFDIDTYRKNYVWNWANVASLRNKDYYYGQIYKEAKRRNVVFPNIKISLLSMLMIISRKMINAKVLNKIKKAFHYS